jgi:hypothetical protein
MLDGEGSDSEVVREILGSLHRYVLDEVMVTEFPDLVQNVLQVFLGNVHTNSTRRFIEGFEYGYPIGLAIPSNGVERQPLPENELQIRQSPHMIGVVVAQIHIEVLGLEVIEHPIHAGTCIQDDAQLRDGVAGGLSQIAGTVSIGT